MKAGFYQFGPVFGDTGANLDKALNALSSEEYDLIVLPELFTTGYQFTSEEEVSYLSEKVPDGPTTASLARLSVEKGCYIVYGIAEKDGEQIFNSAVICGPDGYMGTYRKTHLFFEETLWFSPGNSGFKVWDTEIGRIGIMVCFDWFYPESARILSIMGAEVIAHPSNLVLPYCPDGMPMRCLENSVYAITANRTGTEDRHEDKKALTFIGSSQITGTKGEIIHRASGTNDEIHFEELDLELARSKDFNQYNNIMKDRRPDLYGKLTDDLNDDNS
ncbi:MAG: acyltransferase [Nitrospirota bacterium]|nr:MAG: acyltransferase [Nitrospirota bacterium]